MISVKILDNMLWWSLTLLVSSFYIFGSNIYGKYLMMLLTFLIAVLSVLRYGRKINLHLADFHLSVLAFAVFCLISTWWSPASQLTLEKAITLFQILIYVSVVYIYADHQKSVLPLLDSIRWAGYIMAIYLFIVYGWNELNILLQSGARIDSERINSNIIGMIVAFSIILTLYKILFFKLSIWHLLVIPEFIILSISSSKKAFIILLLGTMFFIALRYGKGNIFKKAVSLFWALAVGVILFLLVWNLPFFVSMKYRLELFFNFFTGLGIIDISTLERSYMIRIGIEQFLNTPLLGLGIDTSSDITLKTLGRATYLHSNYIELLACGGIVGTMVYYFMFLYPGLKLLRKCYSKDNNTLICLVLLILCLITDLVYVSYYYKQTYFFILLFFIQVKLANNEGKNNV